MAHSPKKILPRSSNRGLDASPRDRPGRRDLLIALLLTGLAAVFCFWNLGQLGLQHFDEGSYAMAGRWLATFGRQGHPPQAAQAPGLVPFLVALFFLLFGISDSTAIALSACAGSLLVGWIYWLGMRWSNRMTGILAALFLATAEYHLIYARMILTDAVFALLFWVSLAVLFEALQSGRQASWLAGGLLTGLCWNAKYHGFLPLLIVGLWMLGTRLLSPRLQPARKTQGVSKRKVGRAAYDFRCWLLASGVALLCFLPWIVAVAWTTGWSEILSGIWNHSLGQGDWPPTSPATLAFYLTRWLSPPLLLLATLGLGISLKLGREARFLAWTLLFFSFLALSYSSFPRLVLPLVPGICLLAALALEWLSRLPLKSAKGGWIRAGLAIVVLGWNLPAATRLLSSRTDSYRQAGNYLASRRVPVISQMSKNFYFYEQAGSQEMRWLQTGELDALEAQSPELILAIDPVVLRLPTVLEWVEKRRDRLQPLRQFKILQYEPVRYQGIDPRERVSEQPDWASVYLRGEARIEIFRLLPGRERVGKR